MPEIVEYIEAKVVFCVELIDLPEVK